MDRKDFLKMSGGAALGMALASCGAGGRSTSNRGTIKNLGIQLYSLRDDLPTEGPERRIKKAGFIWL